MGYHIEYGVNKRKTNTLLGTLRLISLTALCIVLFFMLVFQMWPEGTAVMKRSVLYTGATIKASAFADFAGKLEQGETFFAAFQDFCRKVFS